MFNVGVHVVSGGLGAYDVSSLLGLSIVANTLGFEPKEVGSEPAAPATLLENALVVNRKTHRLVTPTLAGSVPVECANKEQLVLDKLMQTGIVPVSGTFAVEEEMIWRQLSQVIVARY